ncbi:hypothetical protein [Oryza sativa Japonica Group]|uniref:Uncharacterized protein n=2 Tax=Oryza sativa subsp. japonica TaxID=39947 RepID=Q7F1C2_ORYSJ|nr:hypothetical protein [Oryza sativa Japonica Group]BAB93440.1 hypothetical protein [Oryza sativa Japonica Group]
MPAAAAAPPAARPLGPPPAGAPTAAARPAGPLPAGAPPQGRRPPGPPRCRSRSGEDGGGKGGEAPPGLCTADQEVGRIGEGKEEMKRYQEQPSLRVAVGELVDPFRYAPPSSISGARAAHLIGACLDHRRCSPRWHERPPDLCGTTGERAERRWRQWGGERSETSLRTPSFAASLGAWRSARARGHRRRSTGGAPLDASRRAARGAPLDAHRRVPLTSPRVAELAAPLSGKLDSPARENHRAPEEEERRWRRLL